MTAVPLAAGSGVPLTAQRPARATLRARCRQAECSHEWVIAHLPMEMETAARLMGRAACPMCGDQRPLAAPQRKEKP